MKKAIILGAAALSAVLLAGCGTEGVKPGETQKEKMFRIGSDLNFPPFEFEENGKAQGFDIELAEAVAKEMGAKLEIKNVTFGDLIPAVKENKIDAILSGFEGSPDRGELLTFSDPYMDAGYSILTARDDNLIKDWDDLRGKVIGTQTGTRHTELSIDFGAQRVQAFEEKENVVKALDEKKVDAIVVDTPVALYYARHDDKVKLVGDPKTSSTGLVFAVKKGNTDLQKKINEALKAVKASGEYDRIYARWFEK